jgi:hypothetical protein
VIIVKHKAQTIGQIRGVNQKMRIGFVANGDLWCLAQKHFEQTADASLTHVHFCAQRSVNTPVHDPLSKPGEPISPANSFVVPLEKQSAVLTLVALMAAPPAPSDHKGAAAAPALLFFS